MKRMFHWLAHLIGWNGGYVESKVEHDYSFD